MRNILLIDDLRIFRENPENGKVYTARTSAEAIKLLTQHPDMNWDEIWFDHDLGLVEQKEDTTLPVADHMAERAFFENPVNVKTVIIHTSNPVGARILTTTMERYGYQTKRVQAEHFFTIDEALY